MHVTLRAVTYTEEQIERITELGRDPKNWQPADQEAWELGRRMAAAVADTYTDDDWRRVLNACLRRGPLARSPVAPPKTTGSSWNSSSPTAGRKSNGFLTVTV